MLICIYEINKIYMLLNKKYMLGVAISMKRTNQLSMVFDEKITSIRVTESVKIAITNIKKQFDLKSDNVALMYLLQFHANEYPDMKAEAHRQILEIVK